MSESRTIDTSYTLRDFFMATIFGLRDKPLVSLIVVSVPLITLWVTLGAFVLLIGIVATILTLILALAVQYLLFSYFYKNSTKSVPVAITVDNHLLAVRFGDDTSRSSGTLNIKKSSVRGIWTIRQCVYIEYRLVSRVLMISGEEQLKLISALEAHNWPIART